MVSVQVIFKREMDALQRELERKRAEVAAARAVSGGGAKVYVRRGDAAKLTSSGAPATSNAAGSALGGSAAAAALASSSAGSKGDAVGSKAAAVDAEPVHVQLEEAEVRRKLRKYGQVVRFFGETVAASAARLHTYELEHVMAREETALPGGYDAGSAVLGKRRQERIAEAVALGFGAKSLALPALSEVLPGAPHAHDDADATAAPSAKRRRHVDDEHAAASGGGAAAVGSAARPDGSSGVFEYGSGAGSGSGAPSRNRSRAGSKDASGDEAAHGERGSGSGAAAVGGAGGPSSATAAPASRAAAAPAAAPERAAAASTLPCAADAYKYRPRPGSASSSSSSGDAHKYCYRFIKGLLAEWERDLAARPPAEAASPRGREESGLWQQSRDYVKPLLRKLKERALADDILTLVTELLGHCEDREYAKAGDAYVRLAIGNAAWPIGVTAVGLHERAAREKVYEGRQAHVMHNEESRKYVTILKRLISYCQRKAPAEPSKSVYY